MLIKTLQVGMLETNCYIVTDEETMKCAIIDPGAESNTILDYVESNSLRTAAILLTHGHFDHRMALETVQESTNAPVYLSAKEVDRNGQNERFKVEYAQYMTYCKEGDEICVGNLTFKVMETPGHSSGSLVYMCEDVLFTGDTLFCGDSGRTDFADGDRTAMLKSLRRIAQLKGDFEVYPGHDESTTLDNERRNNLDMQIAMGEVS